MPPERAKKILEELKSKHRAVSDHFFSDAGVYLMRKDSELILAVTRRCLAAGITALPVHDSVIVPAIYAQLAAEIMVSEFEVRYPHASACKVKTKGRSVPQIQKSLPSISSSLDYFDWISA
jgi:hypothetical protein